MTMITLTPLTPGSFGSTAVDAPISLGEGQEQHLFQSTTGQWIDIRSGTDSAPDVSQNAPFKVNRTLALPPSLVGNILEIQSAIVGITCGVNPGAIQATGVTGIGMQESTVIDTRNDALGVAGYGEIMAVGSVNAAEGVFAAARESISTAFAIGIEVQVQNYARLNSVAGTFTVTIASPAIFTRNSHGLSANDAVVFATTGALPTGLTAGRIYFVIGASLSANTFEVSTTIGGTAVVTSGTQSGTHTVSAPGEMFTENGYSHTVAVVPNPAGNYYNACGIMLGRTANSAFDVGFGVPSFPGVGDGNGPVLSSTYRDCGKSAYSIDVRGTHATAAISVEDGAGTVTIGRRNGAFHASARLGVWTTPGVNATPLIEMGDPSSTAATSFAIRNSNDNFTIGINSGGDGNITLGSGNKFQFGVGGANFMQFDFTGKGAFYGATPVAQPAAYTVTNVTPDRAYDANATTIDELADVLGTLLADLKSLGLTA